MTFLAVVDEIVQFRRDRGWMPLPPEDLAKSIVIEGAELLEHFQWSQRCREIDDVKELDREDIGNEIADIFIYLMNLCEDMEYDILELTQKKLAKLNEKYPVDYREQHGWDHEAYMKLKKAWRRKG